ncbi:MAG: tetratricopeptide repeat protein [Paludibacter sp.]
MKNSNYYSIQLLLKIFLICFTSELSAESAYKKTIYNGFINREMEKWGPVIQTIETTNPPTTLETKLELIDYYYGYIGYLVKKKQYSIAEKLLVKGEILINQVIKQSPKNATAFSYLGAFIGYRIAISKFKAIYLGSQSTFYVNKAYELDPKNIQVNIDKGNILFFSPRIFGGDIEEALKYYLKAVKLIEINKTTSQNWAYLNVLTNIGMAYEKLDQPHNAKLTYEKILSHEPNFYWVKVDLYPKFLVKQKNTN